jgi:hypothetical protein
MTPIGRKTIGRIDLIVDQESRRVQCLKANLPFRRSLNGNFSEMERDSIAIAMGRFAGSSGLSPKEG